MNNQGTEIDFSFFRQIRFDNFQQRFHNRNYIGGGSGSTVQQANDTKNRNKKIAIKTYNKQQLTQYNRLDVVRQYNIYHHFQGRHADQLVQFYGAYKIMKTNGSVQYCIILQYCENSLQNLMKSEDFKTLNVWQKLQMYKRICQAVKQLHDYNIIHRDLKPGNILLAQRFGKKVLVLADFGHSKFLQFGVQNTSMRGTLKYVNPHLVEQSDYSLEWDIYSLGGILIEMLTGKFILQIKHNSINKFLKQIRQKLGNINQELDLFTELTPQTKQLIKRCIKQKYFSIDDVLKRVNQIIVIQKNKEKQIQRLKQIEITNQLKIQNQIKKKKQEEITNQLKIQNQIKNKKQELIKSYISSQNQQKIIKQHSNKEQQTKPNKKLQRVSTVCTEENNTQKDSQPFQNQEEEQRFYSFNSFIDFMDESSIMKKVQGQQTFRQQMEKMSFMSKKQKSKIKPNSTIIRTQNQILSGLQQDQNLAIISKSQKQVPLSPTRFYKSISTGSGSAEKFKLKQKAEKQQSNKVNPQKTNFLAHLLSVQRKLADKIQKANQSSIQISVLQQYQKKLLKIKTIQSYDVSIHLKKKLILFCLIYLKISVKDYYSSKNNNLYTIKYFHTFYDKLTQLQKPIRIHLQGKIEIPKNINKNQIQSKYHECLFNQNDPTIYEELKNLLHELK